MFGISTTTYDPNGAVIVRARIDNPYDSQRRGSVTATLDGGVSVYDGGFVVGDQTMNATLRNPDNTLLQSLRYIVSYYSQVVLSTDYGVFNSVMSFTVSGNVLKFTLRLISRLDA